MQWRYDRVNQLLWENYGHLNLELVKECISFLSPNVTAGYWNDTLIPGMHHSIITCMLKTQRLCVDDFAVRRQPNVCQD